MSSLPKENTEWALRARDVLILAAWFGLVTGLVEGAGLLLFQQHGWLNWNMAAWSVWYEILWVSPALNLLLFCALGLILIGAGRWLPNRVRFPALVFVFAFLMFLDWTLLSGRIRHSSSLILAVGLATLLMRAVKRNAAAVLRFWHRSMPWVAGVALLVFVGVAGGGHWKESQTLSHLRPASAGAPNILLIVVDTLRADHLSIYGYARKTSPNIDRLAEQGVLFEQAISASSWTLPSHASLLTGRFPHEHGAASRGFDGRFPNVAEALLDRGYRTGAFSANVLYFTRQDGFGRGFIRFEDYFHTPADMALRTVWGKKFHMFILRPNGYEDIPQRQTAADINRALLRWLDQGSTQPFFAMLNYMDSHEPYTPPQPFRSRFSKVADPGGRINGFVGRGDPKLTPEQLQEEVDAYDGGIAYMDEQIGRLMEDLRKRGLADNTLVVITSDHGEFFGEHGLLQHRNALYLPVIQVPLVLNWPGRVPAGVRVSSPVSNVSLPATFMELLGSAEKNNFPEPSLSPLWKNPGADPGLPDPLSELAQMHFRGTEHTPAFHGAMVSVLTAKWHYIRTENLGTELFDWKQDAKEMNNLAKTAEGEKITSEFAARLNALLERNPHIASKALSGSRR